MFIDFEEIEACAVYAYKLTVFNQVGSETTLFQNITASPAKPLVVHSPLIILINSTTVRLEWTQPLTYCPISRYILELEQPATNQTSTVDNLQLTSILLAALEPFTSYTVRLVACVSSLLTNACTSSISERFKTPGSPPHILVDQVPHCRLISAQVVSIEWLRPIAINGDKLEYQLIRLDTSTNRTQTVYIGFNTYYLDIDESFETGLLYAYMVVYSNEFGNSFSDWSAHIRTGLDVDSDLLKPIIQNDANNTRSVFIYSSLSVNCESASGGSIEWRPYSTNELVNYLEKLIEFDADFKDIKALETFVIAENLKKNQTTRVAVSDKNRKKAVIRFLQPGSNYSFQLNYLLKFSLLNKDTDKTKNEVVRFFSETVKCSTLSLTEVFGKKNLFK